MYRKCVTEISVEHQKKTEQALLALMESVPFADITVTQLCQAAGITRRVFYHLFSGKDGALCALIDHAILDAGTWASAPDDPVCSFFLYWKEHKPLLDALQANHLTGLLLERMINIVLNEEFDFRHWLREQGWADQKDVTIFYLSGGMGLVFRWYMDGFRESAEEMTARLRQILATRMVPDDPL